MGTFVYGYLLSSNNWKLPEKCELTLSDNGVCCVLGFKIGKIIPDETIYLIPKYPSREDLDASIDDSVPRLRKFFMTCEPRLWYIL